MSKLTDIRTVLSQQRHAVITESHVTRFPLCMEDSFPRRHWTHAVTFEIVPCRAMVTDEETTSFAKGILSAVGNQDTSYNTTPFRNGFGRVWFREEIGTLTQQSMTGIQIDDAEVPLNEKFHSGIWIDEPPAATEALYREISLVFSPNHFLYILASNVRDRSATWIQTPEPEVLERLAEKFDRW